MTSKIKCHELWKRTIHFTLPCLARCIQVFPGWAFLSSNWLYCLRHGINDNAVEQVFCGDQDYRNWNELQLIKFDFVTGCQEIVILVDIWLYMFSVFNFSWYFPPFTIFGFFLLNIQITSSRFLSHVEIECKIKQYIKHDRRCLIRISKHREES